MRHFSILCALGIALVLLVPACKDRGDGDDQGSVPKLPEKQQWERARDKGDARNLDAYLSYYPDGQYAEKAKQLLREVWDKKAAALGVEQMKELKAVIETNYGTVKFRFYPEDAPETVRNFIKLAQSRFYDGLIFHRVIDGYLIQAGDPMGDGMGGPGYNIKAEFNGRPHIEGTVGMARTDDPDSAGSQFYVCLSPQRMLDKKFTVFGQVLEGMDVIQTIGGLPTDQNDRPLRGVIDSEGRPLDISLDDDGLPLDRPLPAGAEILDPPVMTRVYIEGL